MKFQVILKYHVRLPKLTPDTIGNSPVVRGELLKYFKMCFELLKIIPFHDRQPILSEVSSGFQISCRVTKIDPEL